MKITTEQVLHVAQLARLALTPEEAQQLTSDLGAVLGYVEQVQEAGPAPAELAASTSSTLRADTPQPCEPGALLEQAPASRDGLFLVQQVLP